MELGKITIDQSFEMQFEEQSVPIKQEPVEQCQDDSVRLENAEFKEMFSRISEILQPKKSWEMNALKNQLKSLTMQLYQAQTENAQLKNQLSSMEDLKQENRELKEEIDRKDAAAKLAAQKYEEENYNLKQILTLCQKTENRFFQKLGETQKKSGNHNVAKNKIMHEELKKLRGENQAFKEIAFRFQKDVENLASYIQSKEMELYQARCVIFELTNRITAPTFATTAMKRINPEPDVEVLNEFQPQPKAPKLALNPGMLTDPRISSGAMFNTGKPIYFNNGTVLQAKPLTERKFAFYSGLQQSPYCKQ